MNSDSLLFRQVHPNFYPDGQLSSQAFIPFPKDEGQLSVYDGDMITPEQSFVHYTQTVGFASVGVWGLTNAEVASTGLTSRPDPQPDFAEHAVIDFGTMSEKECRKFAKKLKFLAVNRGRLHP